MKASGRLLLITALAVGACGDGSGGGVRAEAGEVLRVWGGAPQLDKKAAEGGAKLYVDSELSMGEDGVAQFRLKQKFNDCRAWRNNHLLVRPAPELIKVISGVTTCSTDDHRSVALRASEAVIDAREVVLSVGTADAGGVARVFYGFAEVRREETAPGQGRLLGPETQTVVETGKEPQPAAPVDPNGLGSAEQQAVAQMVEAKGTPDFGRPAAEGSSTLDAVEEKKLIDVAIDRDSSLPSREFARRFLDFLGDRWGVEVRSRTVGAPQGDAGLRSGAVDVLVTPGSVTAGRAVPFFEDDGNRVWSLHTNREDARFQEALERFLKPALETGEYGRRYLAVFGRVPTYEALRPLVFPLTEPVGPRVDPPASTAPPTTRTDQPPSSTPGSTQPPDGPAWTTTTPPPPSSSSTTTGPVVLCNGKAATIPVGTDGPDNLQGTEGPDVIVGLGGDDEIHGRGGDDTICGGDGDDVIWGDAGNDTIFGNAGKDRAYGGAGDDGLFGQEGDDHLGGGDGADVIEGGIGKDILIGNAGPDIMRGGDGDDILKSNPATDENGSPDVLEGNDGIDILAAADGSPNDRVNGGPGDRDRCGVDPGEPAAGCEGTVD